MKRPWVCFKTRFERSMKGAALPFTSGVVVAVERLHSEILAGGADAVSGLVFNRLRLFTDGLAVDLLDHPDEPLEATRFQLGDDVDLAAHDHPRRTQDGACDGSLLY